MAIESTCIGKQILHKILCRNLRFGYLHGYYYKVSVPMQLMCIIHVYISGNTGGLGLLYNQNIAFIGHVKMVMWTNMLPWLQQVFILVLTLVTYVLQSTDIQVTYYN